jgi:DNA-binding cell septation regulator SpoVG
VKAFSKNTLIAFVDFTILDVGLTVKGSTVHEKEGKRWVGMPAREYTTDEGRKWVPIIEFDSKESRHALNDSVLAAFEAFQARTTKPETTPGDQPW